jgi:hypothetical protein
VADYLTQRFPNESVPTATMSYARGSSRMASSPPATATPRISYGQARRLMLFNTHLLVNTRDIEIHEPGLCHALSKCSLAPRRRSSSPLHRAHDHSSSDQAHPLGRLLKQRFTRVPCRLMLCASQLTPCDSFTQLSLKL